jgi:hypothetical protein
VSSSLIVHFRYPLGFRVGADQLRPDTTVSARPGLVYRPSGGVVRKHRTSPGTGTHRYCSPQRCDGTESNGTRPPRGLDDRGKQATARLQSSRRTPCTLRRRYNGYLVTHMTSDTTVSLLLGLITPPHGPALHLVRLAEAEGFEPPVPLGTLTFKAADRQFRANRPHRLSKSTAPAGPR